MNPKEQISFVDDEIIGKQIGVKLNLQRIFQTLGRYTIPLGIFEYGAADIEKTGVLMLLRFFLALHNQQTLYTFFQNIV